jgi:hypothetical protein
MNLRPLPPVLRDLCLERTEYFNHKSSQFNKILCIASTGVENNKPADGAGARVGGFERINGPHAIKLHGRTYHFLGKSGRANGINHFTFDGLDGALTHNSSVFGESATDRRFLGDIFNELQIYNPFVAELEMIGCSLKQIDLANPNEDGTPAVDSMQRWTSKINNVFKSR